jgi:hypothetical protein
MQTISEKITSVRERLEKAQEVNQVQIDALEAANRLLSDVDSLLGALDIKMDKMRENLQ